MDYLSHCQWHEFHIGERSALKILSHPISFWAVITKFIRYSCVDVGVLIKDGGSECCHLFMLSKMWIVITGDVLFFLNCWLDNFAKWCWLFLLFFHANTCRHLYCSSLQKGHFSFIDCFSLKSIFLVYHSCHMVVTYYIFSVIPSSNDSKLFQSILSNICDRFPNFLKYSLILGFYFWILKVL